MTKFTNVYFIKSNNRIILTLTICLLIAPIIMDIGISGLNTPFRYFAADSFYYFTVARNMAETGIVSFDQNYPTNGFHPIWQAFLALQYKIFLLLGLSEPVYLIIVLLISVFFVSLGILLIGIAMSQCGRELPSFFLVLPVGVYALLLLPLWVYSTDIRGFTTPLPLFGTMWSFMNGMESGLVLFVFGMLALVFVLRKRIPIFSSPIMGFLASMLALSRLDHIFISGSFFLFYLLAVLFHRTRKSLNEFLLFTTCLAIPLLIYMIINHAYAGTILPVSGSLKSTFPMPTWDNFHNMFTGLTRIPSGNLGLNKFYRMTQTLIPCVAVVVMFFWTTRYRNLMIRTLILRVQKFDQFDVFLLVTGIGVFLLEGYNFLFVPMWEIGHWYFPVPILFVSLMLLNNINCNRVKEGAKSLKFIIYGVVCVLVFVFLHRRPEYNRQLTNFYFVEAKAVQEYYGKNIPKLIEYDDGIIAFSTRYPTMSGFGYTLDKEAYQAKKEGRFLELALKRGFDRMTTLAYINLKSVQKPQEIGTDISRVQKSVTRFMEDSQRYDIFLDYVSPSDTFWIFRFQPKVSNGKLHK